MPEARPAALPDPGTGGRGVVHLQGDVTETTALVVVVDTVVLGKLDCGLLRLRAVSHERERELAVNEASFTVVMLAQQAHTQHPGAKANGAFQVADSV